MASKKEPKLYEEGIIIYKGTIMTHDYSLIELLVNNGYFLERITVPEPYSKVQEHKYRYRIFEKEIKDGK